MRTTWLPVLFALACTLATGCSLLDSMKNDYRKATEATIAALPDKTITTAVEGRIVAGK